MAKKSKLDDSENEIDPELDNEDLDINEKEDTIDDLSDDLNHDLNDDEIGSQNLSEDNNIDTEFIEENYYENYLTTKYKVLTGENRKSRPMLTRYEMVRLLGERVKQLITGAKPMIKNYKDLTYEEIAENELINNVMPFKIKRPLPNNEIEIWTLDELYKDHLINLLDSI